MNYFKEVLEAYQKNLKEAKTVEEAQKQQHVASMKKKFYLQRQTRVINDLFNIFFSAEC